MRPCRKDRRADTFDPQQPLRFLGPFDGRRAEWAVAASLPAIVRSGRGARVSMPAKESFWAICSTPGSALAFPDRAGVPQYA